MARFLVDAAVTLVGIGVVLAVIVVVGIIRSVNEDYPRDDEPPRSP